MSNYFKPIIWVEGNIGCGKTTFTEILANILKFRAFYEPAEDNPYLGMFYADPKKWAFPMQIYLLHRRYAMQQLAAYECTVLSDYKGAILDRGLPGDRVFAKIHTDDGNIEQMDFDTTYELAYNIMARTLTPPSLLIYLKATPEKCFERTQKRAREQETKMPTEEFKTYLGRLHLYYEELIEEVKLGGHAWSQGIQVMELDWNADIQSTLPQANPSLAPVIHKIKRRLNYE